MEVINLNDVFVDERKSFLFFSLGKITSLLWNWDSFLNKVVLQNTSPCLKMCSFFLVFSQAVHATSYVQESDLHPFPMADKGSYQVLRRMPFQQTDLQQLVYAIIS